MLGLLPHSSPGVEFCDHSTYRLSLWNSQGKIWSFGQVWYNVASKNNESPYDYGDRTGS